MNINIQAVVVDGRKVGHTAQMRVLGLFVGVAYQGVPARMETVAVSETREEAEAAVKAAAF